MYTLLNEDLLLVEFPVSQLINRKLVLFLDTTGTKN